MDLPPLRYREAVRSVLGIACLTAVLALLVFPSADFGATVRWLVAWLITVMVVVGVVKWALFGRLEALASGGELDRVLAVIGTADSSAQVLHRLDAARQASRSRGTRIELVAEISGDADGVEREALEDLERCLVSVPEVEVILALPLTAERCIARVIDRLADYPIDVWLVVGSLQHGAPTSPMHALNGVPCTRVLSRPITGRRAVAKRATDLLVAGVALVLVAPVLALLALAVRLESPGPAIFRQKRHGFNGQVIEILKLRTMRMDEGESDPKGWIQQAGKGDRRITQVGRWLRRTSLDELPQLVNVLKGEMSLVGPRPHAIVHNEYFGSQVVRYAARHRVKPGITGWAQINGLRGETETIDKMKRRIDYDLDYIENWSLALDLLILLRTLGGSFVHPEAR